MLGFNDVNEIIDGKMAIIIILLNLSMFSINYAIKNRISAYSWIKYFILGKKRSKTFIKIKNTIERSRIER